MTPKTCPRPAGMAGHAGDNRKRPNHSTSAPWFNGFACAWCGTWFPWGQVGAFTPLGPGRALRWCDDCADAYERLADPPVFMEGAA